LGMERFCQVYACLLSKNGKLVELGITFLAELMLCALPSRGWLRLLPPCDLVYIRDE